MTRSMVGVETVDGVGILTLARPDVLNALSPDLIGQLGQEFKTLASPGSGVRCIVITGEGRAFQLGRQSRRGQRERSSRRRRGIHPPARLSPVSPAVARQRGADRHGSQRSRGRRRMSIAMMGDIITCARSAYFLQAFRRIGLVMDCGSSWLLPRKVGVARARELSLLGNKLDAETALQWGLVNRVFDDATFMEETLAIARQIADGPLAAQGKIRRSTGRRRSTPSRSNSISRTGCS